LRRNVRQGLDPVDSDVHDGGSRLDEFPGHEARFPDRGDEDVRPAADGCEVPRARVAKRHGGVARGQQRGDGLSDDLAPAEDNGVGSRDRDTSGVEQSEDAGGGAGHEARPPLDEPSHVLRMHAIHVL
jgi:hypothetical protein